MSKLSSTTETQSIKVEANPQYVEENSNPNINEYLFSYQITITNNSDKQVKLVSRHWLIIDANGNREEINGAGVVGQTPTIEPGESFDYQSFCPLKTPWGTMEGNYQMEDDNGEVFEIKVGRFFLASSN